MTSAGKNHSSPSDIVARLTATFSSKAVLAVCHGGQVCCFDEFWQMVNDKAHILYQQSTQQYALWHDDSLEFLSWLLALVLTKKEIILPPSDTQQLKMDFAKDGIVWLDEHFDGYLSSHLSGDLPALNLPTLNLPAFDLYSLDFTARFERIGIYFFTSGSTGTPKKIPRSFMQLLLEASHVYQELPFPKNYIAIASVSHQHLYGLTFKLLMPLLHGQCFFIPQGIYPENIDDTLRYFYQNTAIFKQKMVLILSPALLKRCATLYRFEYADVILSSGGRLDNGVREHYPSGILEIFGSSETGAIAYRMQDNALWQAFCDVEIAQNEQNQLCLSSQRAYQSDWLTTSDCVTISDDGRHFALLGRSDRIVKLEEKRLSLDDIERTIATLPAVLECHTVLVEHGKRMFLSAVVVLDDVARHALITQGKVATITTLKQALKGKLEPIATPKHWRFIHHLPRNTQSKINQQWVKNLFLNQRYPHVLHQQSSDEYQCRLTLEFSPELDCFKGHFDGFPIYPGVGQVGFLVHFAKNKWLDLDYCTALEQVKFQELIRPFDVLELQFKRDDNKVSFRLLSSDNAQDDGQKTETTPAKVIATGRLVFAITQTNPSSAK